MCLVGAPLFCRTQGWRSPGRDICGVLVARYRLGSGSRGNVIHDPCNESKPALAQLGWPNCPPIRRMGGFGSDTGTDPWTSRKSCARCHCSSSGNTRAGMDRRGDAARQQVEKCRELHCVRDAHDFCSNRYRGSLGLHTRVAWALTGRPRQFLAPTRSSLDRGRRGHSGPHIKFACISASETQFRAAVEL